MTKEEEYRSHQRERCVCGEVRGSHSFNAPHPCFGCGCPGFRLPEGDT